MNIKYKNIGFEEGIKFVPKKMKPAKKPNILFKTLLKVVSLFDLLAVKFKANKIGMDKIKLKDPCLILMNHCSFLDLEIATSVLYPKSINIVTTTDAFVDKAWLMREIGCLPINKFSTNPNVVKECIRLVKKKNTSILMYPEAGYSFDGTATTMANTIGKFVKMLNVPLVTIITHGAFLRQPLYNNLRKRKVKVTADIEYVLSPEDIKKMTAEEINQVVFEKFGFDAFKEQQDANMVIDDPNRAEGLNRVMYKCPHCMSEDHMVGEGTTVTCTKCGASYELTETGYLKNLTGETKIDHVPNWYKWEREEVRKELLANAYETDTDVEIYMLKDPRRLHKLGEGHLHHDNSGFTLTGGNGLLNYHQGITHSHSVNSDFYWYQVADIVCVGDHTVLYYCVPKKKINVAKVRLAAEELYKLAKEKVL